MITQGYLAEMAAYNRWQNDTLYHLCEEIGDAARRLDRGMYFYSLHGTLDHICMVNRAILAFLEEDRPPPSQYGDIVWPDWDTLKSVRLSQDALFETLAADWSEDWMVQSVIVKSSRLKSPRSMPRWVLIVQMFNHQTHHRSQATAELHRMGLDYGSTDMPFRPGAGYLVD